MVPDHETVDFALAIVLPQALGWLDPHQIRFTQASIKNQFRDGTTLLETIQALSQGRLSPNQFPPIRLFEVQGILFTLDNRRLYVFQQVSLPIHTVAATMTEIIEERFKFTTKTGGRTIRLRGGGEI